MIEVESLDEFDAHLASHGSLRGVAIQGVDLRSRHVPLVAVDVHGTAFLGCEVDGDVQRRLTAAGAMFFPPFDDLPFRAFRGHLYDATELFAGYRVGDPESVDDAVDTRVYRWYRSCLSGPPNVVHALAQRVHDHAIDDALANLLDDPAHPRRRRVVAVMGGHGMRRDSPEFADVARLGWALTRAGFLVASGGGPGAMEATNLGGWMADRDEAELTEALELLARAPTHDRVADWLDAGFAVRERFPVAGAVVTGIGVPTWHYGHEPPNVFASHIAKYFANSVREDGLLAMAMAGVVFAPGSAGTIQEVFQDAAQNHYESFGGVSPMVFLGTRYWTETKPVYPLLRTLAADRAYGRLLSIHDEVDAVVETLSSHAAGAD